MLSKFTRGAVLLFVAVMIAAYALSAAKSGDSAEPAKEQPADRMYS